MWKWEAKPEKRRQKRFGLQNGLIRGKECKFSLRIEVIQLVFSEQRIGHPFNPHETLSFQYRKVPKKEL